MAVSIPFDSESDTTRDFRRPPRGGFAFGIDRLTALLVGEDHIRSIQHSLMREACASSPR
ncbi:MAG: lysyl-tRNA synthetase class II [Candidatus Aldehydirespiratoraceae bacterium]|jgi:lysyl-tRNA synthetase class II